MSTLGLALAVQGLWGSSDVGGQTRSLPIEITEINANTGMGRSDAAFEWIELHNASTVAHTLDGWSVADNQSSDPLGTLTIAADGFALIVASEEGRVAAFENVAADVVVFVIADGRIGNGLANTGDRVLLRDSTGNVVDGVSWGNDASVTDRPAAAAEETLSRTPGDGIFRIGDATPGRPAASADALASDPPALVIAEIFANAGLGQTDAAGEWIEILNPFAEAVELARWRIADNAGSDLIPDVTIGGGERLVIAATADAVTDESKRVVIEDGRIGNGLANGGDEVSLLDAAGRVVDRVIYGAGAIPRPEPGRSIARINGAWVVNTDPSPGRDAVSPLLATLIEDREREPSSVRVREGSDDEASIPAWALVAIFIGVSVGTLTLYELWRRRRSIPWLRPPSR